MCVTFQYKCESAYRCNVRKCIWHIVNDREIPFATCTVTHFIQLFYLLPPGVFYAQQTEKILLRHPSSIDNSIMQLQNWSACSIIHEASGYSDTANCIVCCKLYAYIVWPSFPSFAIYYYFCCNLQLPAASSYCYIRSRNTFASNVRCIEWKRLGKSTGMEDFKLCKS